MRTLALLLALSFAGALAQEAPAVSPSVQAAGALVPAKPRIMAEAPPKQPKVVCRGNEMSISADNSTLSSILAGVHRCIGVQIDIPEGRGGARIFGELGPGPVRDVLDALLSGTELNYVIGSSGPDPEKVDSVLLMVKANDQLKGGPGAAGDFALTPARRAWLSTQRNNRPTAGTTPEDLVRSSGSEPDQAPPADEAAAASPAENAGPPANAPGADAAPASPPDNSAAPPADANPSPAQDKSTEDHISDMQQLFEQRRQMMANQNTAPK